MTPTATAEPIGEATGRPLELSFRLCGNEDCTQSNSGADGYTVSWTVTGDERELRQIVDNGAVASIGMAAGAEPVSLAAYQSAQPASWTITAVLQGGVATGLSEPLPLGIYTVCLNPLLVGPNGSTIRIAETSTCDRIELGETGPIADVQMATFSAVIVGEPVVMPADGGTQEPEPGSGTDEQGNDPGEGTAPENPGSLPDDPAAEPPGTAPDNGIPAGSTSQVAELATSTGGTNSHVAGLPVTGSGPGDRAATAWILVLTSAALASIAMGIRRRVRVA